jgi:hypothetical protein
MRATHSFGVDEDGFSRRARRRDRRLDRLLEDVVRFALVVGVLLWLVRPIGVIVALVWGLRLLRRYAGLELFPRLHRHWLDQELGCAHRSGTRDHARRGEGGRGSEERLLSAVGERRSARNVERARGALADAERLARAPSAPAPRSEAVHVGELAEAALEALRPAASRRGVELRLRADAVAELRGDPDAVLGVLLAALDWVIDGYAGAAAGGVVELASGEDLARTRVWLEIRHDAPPLDRERLDRAAAAFLANEEPGRVVLEFSTKRAPRVGALQEETP